MSTARSGRTIAGATAATLAFLGGMLALSACGSSAPAQLAVSLAPDSGQLTTKPGDLENWTLVVSNKGNGTASGVHVQLDLPADFHYQATPQIERDTISAVRLSATDPTVQSQAPQWGTWRIDPSTANADGTKRCACVQIHFTMSSGGNPGDYNLVPHATDDAVDGDVAGQTQVVHLQPAPKLQAQVSVTPQTVQRGQDVLYRVTVLNLGTGPAEGLSVLATLPDALTFAQTESVTGNSARGDHPTDPVPGTLEVYYSGFTVPASSDAGGPGKLEITLRAHCAFGTGGRYSTTVQFIDAAGDALTVPDTAPITVDAPATPPRPYQYLPPAQAAPTPASTPSPAATPTPSH